MLLLYWPQNYQLVLHSPVHGVTPLQTCTLLTGPKHWEHTSGSTSLSPLTQDTFLFLNPRPPHGHTLHSPTLHSTHSELGQLDRGSGGGRSNPSHHSGGNITISPPWSAPQTYSTSWVCCPQQFPTHCKYDGRYVQGRIKEKRACTLTINPAYVRVKTQARDRIYYVLYANIYY